MVAVIRACERTGNGPAALRGSVRGRAAAGRTPAPDVRGSRERTQPGGTVVLALPRGGVPVGREVAIALRVPLDVLVTRKIGYPLQPELGVGALAEGGQPVFDEEMLARLGLTAAALAPVVSRNGPSSAGGSRHTGAGQPMRRGAGQGRDRRGRRPGDGRHGQGRAAGGAGSRGRPHDSRGPGGGTVISGGHADRGRPRRRPGRAPRIPRRGGVVSVVQPAQGR
jgi:hypothetical protein